MDPVESIVADFSAQRPSDPTAAGSLIQEAAVAFRRLGCGSYKAYSGLMAIAAAWGIGFPVKEMVALSQDASEGAAKAPTGLQELIQAQINGTYSLVPWPFPIVTERSRSLLPGSVTVLCGAPGSAKSWWTISCLRYWIDGVAPAAVLMLEETRAWHLNRVLAQLEGNPNILDCLWCRSNPAEITAAHERHRDAISAISANLWCQGDQTLAKCAEWVEHRCAAKCRVIVIDPITLADPGNEKPWDADRRFMTRVKVAIEAAGASLVLVSHPRKTTGKQMGPPTMDDMAGGVVYSRAAASLIWLSGTAPGTEMTTIDADGRADHGPVHKTMRIMKARNSTGQHDTIGFRFTSLSFREAGRVVTEPVEDNRKPLPHTSGRSRGQRMKSEPHSGEDVF